MGCSARPAWVTECTSSGSRVSRFSSKFKFCRFSIPPMAGGSSYEGPRERERESESVKEITIGLVEIHTNWVATLFQANRGQIMSILHLLPVLWLLNSAAIPGGSSTWWTPAYTLMVLCAPGWVSFRLSEEDSSCWDSNPGASSLSFRCSEYSNQRPWVQFTTTTCTSSFHNSVYCIMSYTHMQCQAWECTSSGTFRDYCKNVLFLWSLPRDGCVRQQALLH